MYLGQQSTVLLAPGRAIGGCRIIRPLGRGGMGEVYLAEHLALKKHVAVKILPPGLARADSIKRFIREARTCSRIEHPNVVIIHDVGKHHDLHYIVMQYVQGKNLAELIDVQGGPLPWRSALKVIRLAAKGLEAVHRNGLIHRDIKPSNIMLANDSRVLLMDFGLVRDETADELSRSGRIVGTPAYMSPEQCSREKIDKRSDLFSLGGTLYTLLTGRLPYPGNLAEMFRQISSGSSPRPIAQINPLVPREVTTLVAKAMAPRKADRFNDARTMAAEISKLLNTLGPAATASFETASVAGPLVQTVPAPELAPLELLPDDVTLDPEQSFNPWVIGGIAIAACVLLGIMLNVFVYQRPSHQEKQASSGPDGTAQSSMPDTAGMIKIPGGKARLGNSKEKLRSYFETVRELAEDQDLLQQAITAFGDEPERIETVMTFWIDKYEVTNELYATFVRATGHSLPTGWIGSLAPSGLEEHPVTNLSFKDAQAYARWKGKKLPTHAQWIRAFREDRDSMFPWGDQLDPDQANVGGNDFLPLVSTTAVTATPGDVTSQGVGNLVGNACEFIRDRPPVPGTSYSFVLLKGGDAVRAGKIYGIAASTGKVYPGVYPDPTDWKHPVVGFRCVLEQPAGETTTESK